MIKYLVIGYPEMAAAEHKLIENFRKENDHQATLIGMHFTFLFPVEGINVAELIGEIRKQTRQLRPLTFILRCAVMSKDVFSNNYHIFLVPDEGFSQMIKLHDKLYSGIMQEHRRFDLDYIPHITIGNATDKMICKKMVDHWNSLDFEIKGIINAVNLIKLDNGSVEIVEHIKLGPI